MKSVHWRCFHCDATFTKEQAKWAREHFGADETATPVCLMRVPGEDALLSALRNAEDQLSRYRAEDSDLMRALHAQAADHQSALRRAEENGYGKGLNDGLALDRNVTQDKAPSGTTRIYFASKTHHHKVWKAIRGSRDDVKIVSSWIDLVGAEQKIGFQDLWRRCLDDLSSCHVVIAYREDGETLKGAFLEIGAALVLRKPVIMVGAFDEFTFTSASGVRRMPSIAAAVAFAADLWTSHDPVPCI